VILTMNGISPFCRICGERVRYKLVRAVPHISEDPDFTEFVPVIDDDVEAQKTGSRQAFPLQLGWAHGFRFWYDTAQARRDSTEVGDL
jgi:hypothetical protein